MWKKGEKISLPPSFFEKEMAGQDHYQLTAQENIRMATPAEETLGSGWTLSAHSQKRSKDSMKTQRFAFSTGPWRSTAMGE